MKLTRLFTSVGWLMLALPAIASAAPQATVPATGTAASAPATAAAAGAPRELGPDYLIGPGDTLQVFVWRNPELTVTVPVRPDGKVSTPLIEDMVAVGKTPSQLARDMEARLTEYIRSPQVNIIVTASQSTFSQITVIGQVRNPSSVPYREGMTLLDVMLAVGGLGDFAAGNRAKLVRKDANGKDIETRVKLDDLVRKGRIRENREVKAGDVIIVPESFF